MKHKHRWGDWGTFIGENDITETLKGKRMSACSCGNIMFHDVLEPEKKRKMMKKEYDFITLPGPGANEEET
jgi:hypothetical protein